ncbi:restriction endonuclease subunit S [Amycolatopsis sp. CFH S0078]|uniref:restriction endonuclease subunit S n=1 Tax=Amycolatopsis sp. CFH S0078 TaxID=1644108 RepID=UPI00351135B1
MPLGDLMTLDVNTVEVDPAQTYDIVGVLNRGRGLLYREPMAGSATAYKTLNRVGQSQIVYSRLKAFEGAITVAPADLHEVYASQEFPTFTCGPSLLPDYFRILTTTKSLWSTLQSLSTGMGGRRERVKPKDFLTISIALPSLEQQRRIVHVVDTVDKQVEILEKETDSLRRVLRSHRAAVMESPDIAPIRADEAFSILMGRQRSPKRANGPHMTNYLRSANVGNGKLNLSDVLQMDFDPSERERFCLQSGDILVSEGSASEKAVGMAAMWRDELPGPVCFQNTLLRYRAVAGVSIPSFVNHWCKWAYESGLYREVASGTNIKHIGSTRAAAMPARIPDLAAQEMATKLLDAIEVTVEAGQNELSSLRSVRLGILSALLSRQIEVDIMLDRFLEEKAA